MERRLPFPEPVQKDKAKKEPAMDDDDCDEEEEEEEEEAMDGRGGAGNDDDKKRRSSAFNGGILRRGGGGGGGGGSGGGGGGGLSQPCCQVEKCGVDLADAKRYHRRHKVCEAHFKAPVVIVAGIRQRFCQQCSRFHELSEFDESKRSCRRRLAGHNERRRKSSSESQGEGSSRCRQADQSERMQMALPGNPTYKHFQIR